MGTLKCRLNAVLAAFIILAKLVTLLTMLVKGERKILGMTKPREFRGGGCTLNISCLGHIRFVDLDTKFYFIWFKDLQKTCVH